MAEEKDFGPIYRRLFNQLPLYTHPAPWQDVPVPADVRRSVADPAAVVADLLTLHTQAELVEASVLTFDSDASVELNPALREADTAIMALRTSAENDPFDLLAGGATLSGAMLPICAALRDASIRQMLKGSHEKVLCLTSSPADVVLLLSLNIPATFDTGLGQLSGTYLQQVRNDFQLDPPKPNIYAAMLDGIGNDEPSKANRPPELLYVAWSPTKLSVEEPPELAEIISHLVALEKHLNLCMDRFYRWQPTAEHIEHMAFSLNYTDLEDFKSATVESLADADHLVPIPKAPKTPNPPEAGVQSLPEAIAELDMLRSNPQRDPKAERRAWENILRAIKEKTIDPMYQAMEASDDPIGNNYLLMGAMNGQLLYQQQARLLQKHVAWEKQADPGKLAAYSEQEFKQVMDASDRQLKILKGLIDHKSNPPFNWP